MLLTIEKMIYGGEGLAHLPADDKGRGKAVFVPFVLAEEKIGATLSEQKPSFARASAQAIIEPSPHRIAPACPYFGTCGACHYQHASYEHQLEIKKEILRETLRRTAKIELQCEVVLHPSPPWNYRNRSRFQVQTKPAFAAGYFRAASHQLLSVEQCPISSPLINRALTALWDFGRAGKVPEGIREIEFFANADDAQLMVELDCVAEARRAAVRAFVEEFQDDFPEILGIVAFRSQPAHPPTKGVGRVGQPSLDKFLTLGANHLVYQTQHHAFRVSAGSFFQTNRHLIDDLVRIVTAGQSGQLAFDLYAGVGLFSTALGDFHHIVSVESSQLSSDDLSYNLPSNGEAIQASTDDYLGGARLSGRAGKGAVLPHGAEKPDLAVVDPPRSGLGEKTAGLVAKLAAPRVVYVSCDPATLARDLVTLLAAGYRIEQTHLVDLFPQTYHMETVLHLVR